MSNTTLSISSYIEELGTALFSNTGNDVLKLPTQIVQTIKANDNGEVWILMRKPVQRIEQFNQSFPAYLHFHRKGHGVSIQANGKATIIVDPEILQSYMNAVDPPIAATDTIVVHVHLQHIELFDLTAGPSRSSQGWLDWWREKTQWLYGKKRVQNHREWSFS